MGNSPSRDGSPRHAGPGPRGTPTRLRYDVSTGVATDDAPSIAPDQTPASSIDPFHANYGSVMLQGFHWRSCNARELGLTEDRSWYGEVLANIPALVQTGVDAVWLPPPSHSVSPEGYLPQRLYDLDTKYGTKEELKTLCRELKAAGIKPMADIVINHRCADTQDENGLWRIFSNVSFPPDERVEPGKSFDRTWGPWAIVKDDPVFQGEGNSDTGESFPPAPDLDHANERVRGELTTWLNWLKHSIGFEGWRFDYAKGYGAKFVDEYVANTVGVGAMNVAEFWPEASWEPDGGLAVDQNPMRQSICDWLDRAKGSTAAFDFATKAVLQEAVAKNELWRLRDKDGKPPGLIGWWPQRAVTFVDNHDTGGTGQAAGTDSGRMKDGSDFIGGGSYGQGHWRFPPEHRMLGYAYILTHPGVPCLFWPHAVRMPDGRHGDMAAEVATMVQMRKNAGIVADSPVEILIAESDVYVARVRGSNADVTVKLGPRYDFPKEIMPAEGGREWKMRASGEDYAIWSRPHPTRA